jgi:hypothetical protein
VEDHYSVTAYTFVHDFKDVYIEVKDEDEAELLENMNRLEEHQLKLKNQWREKYSI